MATVNGLTKERMLDIEASSVTDGEIVGDDLVLTTRGGTPINAGNVRGPEGPVFTFPVEIPLPCFGNTAPLGYYLLAGGIYDPIACPGLWGLFGITHGGTAESPLLPDFRGKTIFGYDATDPLFNVLGGSSGSPDVTLTETELPEHTHIQDAHNHTQNAHSHIQNPHTHIQDAHSHPQVVTANTGGTAARRDFAADLGGYQTYAQGANTYGTIATNQNTTPTNQNTTATNNETTSANQSTGSGQPFSIIPSNIALNWIIRAA